MRLPAALSPAPLISAEIAPPALAGTLLRLHAVLTQADLWQVLRLLAREAVPSASLTLELYSAADDEPPRVYRHNHPALPRETQVLPHPAASWLATRRGVPVFRLSDIAPLRDLRGSGYYERVMRRTGWERQLAVLAWQEHHLLGAWNFYRGTDEPDFTQRELRLAQALQPHVSLAVQRVLAHERAIQLSEQLRHVLEDAPIGLLVLDWELHPLWFNREGAQACAVWNHGERRASALNPRRTFRVPAPIAAACAQLRTEWLGSGSAIRERGLRPHPLSHDAAGVHVQIVLRTVGAHPGMRPCFEVQLDYRRPRGDRHRALSPGALALLGRLSPREREVAMRVREGLGTREIAAELHRSPLTIKTQLASIFRKLETGRRSRVAALLNR